jgi:hypothetical protein
MGLWKLKKEKVIFESPSYINVGGLKMDTKVCKKCGEEKPFSEFYKDKSKPDGYYSSCKSCKNGYFKSVDPEKKKKKKRKYYEKHKDRLLEYGKEYYQEHRDESIERSRRYYDENKERVLERGRKRYKKYYDENKETILDNQKIRNKNRTPEQKERFRKRKREYKKKRYNEDIDFRISCTMRSRISNVLSGRLKHGRTFEMVGCDIDQLKCHLEKQFEEGMSWENYGDWHIDHIKPCCSFDLSNKEEQEKCFHYTNLQPLWGEENQSKGGRS